MFYGFYEGKGGGNNLNYKEKPLGEAEFFIPVIGKLLLKELLHSIYSADYLIKTLLS